MQQIYKAISGAFTKAIRDTFCLVAAVECCSRFTKPIRDGTHFCFVGGVEWCSRFTRQNLAYLRKPQGTDPCECVADLQIYKANFGAFTKSTHSCYAGGVEWYIRDSGHRGSHKAAAGAVHHHRYRQGLHNFHPCRIIFLLKFMCYFRLISVQIQLPRSEMYLLRRVHPSLLHSGTNIKCKQ